jgi:hypothetical protein
MIKQISKWMRLLRISGYVTTILAIVVYHREHAIPISQYKALKTTFPITGGDGRVDRRVEKRLGHVHRIDTRELRYWNTIYSIADRLAH